MLAAFATLVFLATVLVAVAAIVHSIQESGGKVLAALTGQSMAPAVRAPVAARVRYRQASQRVVSARQKLRAAA